MTDVAKPASKIEQKTDEEKAELVSEFPFFINFPIIIKFNILKNGFCFFF